MPLLPGRFLEEPLSLGEQALQDSLILAIEGVPAEEGVGAQGDNAGLDLPDERLDVVGCGCHTCVDEDLKKRGPHAGVKVLGGAVPSSGPGHFPFALMPSRNHV